MPNTTQAASCTSRENPTNRRRGRRQSRDGGDSDREYKRGFRSGLLAAADGIKAGMTAAQLMDWYRRLVGFGGQGGQHR
jgi:hypothetical protein